MNTITTEVIPCGGIVKVSMTSTDAAPWTLTRRYTDTNNVVHTATLLSGEPDTLFLDIGDGTNVPLNPTIAYTYTFTTASGSVSSLPTTPAGTLLVEQDPFGRVLLRVLQAGFVAVALPDGFQNPPTVMEAMPLTGQPRLPIIALNEDLLQQVNVPIGHGINTDDTKNEYIIEDIAHRRYRISILTSTTEEREFYKQATLGIFRSILNPLLQSLGQNIRHGYQAASSQVTDKQNSPGFYFCDIGLDFDGVFAVRVSTNYGTMATIGPDVHGGIIGAVSVTI